MSESERCYRFEDCCPSPDPFFDDYDEYEGSEVPVVIDNGAYQCKAGWAGESQPKLIFRNVTAKSKAKREFDASTVGSDIGNLETVRWALRSQFDRNVVTHFETQELIFDHVFSHLGIATENFVDHPVVLTEPVCNPNYCRGMMSELLFECYGVPKVAYGIDALFGLHFNQKPPNSVDSLVVSCGYQTTHILPVLKGRLDASQCKRINVGGSHIAWFLQRLLQLKYPAHQQVVTLSRAEELIHRYAHMALDFAAELDKWQNPNQMIDRIIKMQLPYTPIPVLDPEAAALKEEREKEKKARQGQRLQEMAARKRQEKLEENERQLEGWLSLLALRNSDPDQFERLLSHFGFDSADDLEASIQQVQQKIVKAKAAMDASVKDEVDASSAAKKPKEETNVSEEWLQDLKDRRRALIDSRYQRQMKRRQLSDKRSMASKERMRIIAELARNDTATGNSRGKPAKEDTFGQNDDDWHIYREINKESIDSDNEKDEAELKQLEQLLRQHDPDFQPSTVQHVGIDAASFYQLHLGIERFRSPELLYQPSLIGVDQAGIAETIQFVLKHYDPEDQQRLVDNVFVTGGSATLPNFLDRLKLELQAARPFKSKFSVSCSKDPVFDAWSGASSWAQDVESKSGFVSRQEYFECGSDYLKEHYASNAFVPSNTT